MVLTVKIISIVKMISKWLSWVWRRHLGHLTYIKLIANPVPMFHLFEGQFII